jgi:hypothetical protein
MSRTVAAPNRSRADGDTPAMPTRIVPAVSLARRVLAVLDDRASADRAAVAARKAGATVVERLEGDAAADAIDATGVKRGVVARVGRAVQFSVEDQMPALAWYEAALRDGRIVLAVPTTGRDQTLAVVAALEAAGGHFINRFGRLATEEFARWRGVEPNVSSLLK